MSPKNKKKLNILRGKLDKLDNKLINIIKVRTNLVNEVVQIKPEYDKFHREDGHFACRGCGKPLYTASAKFKSSCGWPAFDKCLRDSVVISEDRTLEPTRIEITCAGCDGHLGHVFAGERLTPTNERHCVNSVSILYVEAENAADERLAQGLASSMPQAEEKVLTMQKLARIRKGADHGTLATSQGATLA